MDTPDDARADALRRLEVLAERVDAFSAAAAHALGPRLTCTKGCTGCCGREVRVFSIEAERLQRHVARHGLPGAPAPAGCPLLGADGGCRAYAARPLICRTHGLPIRFKAAQGEARDVCPLNQDAGLDPWGAPDGSVLNVDVLNAQLVALERLFGGLGERVGVGQAVRAAGVAP